MKFTLRFTVCFCLLLPGLKAFSQDVIILKNGDEIQSKVTEVLPDIIKYKKWNNQDGPVYSSNKADVFMIKYQNGTKDVFNTTQVQTTPKPIDNSNKILDIAKPFMENQIASESKGACKLVEFNKQNGVEKDIFGQKIYTLEYKLKMELQKDFWKASADKWLGKDWYWTSFTVLDKKGDVYSEQFTNNYEYFTKGTRVEVTGEIDFESTDNGWRIAGVNMFSNGYKNKTSKVLQTVSIDSSVREIPQKKSDLPLEVEKGSYVGDIKDGKKEGHGKMIYDNGNIYEGDWKNDKKSGHGRMIYNNSQISYNYGNIYDGNWKDDKKNGIGNMTYKNGATYEGEWKDDKREGSGTVIGSDGRKYVGPFFDDQQHGKGITYGKNGNVVFEGEYKNGKIDGFGVSNLKDEDSEYRYEGEFKNGNHDGQGVLTYKDKKDGSITTQTGYFKYNELYNGTTVVVYLNGTKKTTEVKDGKEGKVRKEKPKKEK